MSFLHLNQSFISSDDVMIHKTDEKTDEVMIHDCTVD